jgi:hypothetical protein
MKTNDYVKYMTQTFVKFIDQPREERVRQRQARRENKAAFWYRWFGIMPYILYSEVKKRKRS